MMRDLGVERPGKWDKGQRQADYRTAGEADRGPLWELAILHMNLGGHSPHGQQKFVARMFKKSVVFNKIFVGGLAGNRLDLSEPSAAG